MLNNEHGAIHKYFVKIVYYTSGITGSGRLVLGLAIKNALRRMACTSEFIILHSAPSSDILEGITHFKLPIESAAQTDKDHYPQSSVYQLLTSLSPDVVVDLLWIPLHHLLEKLACKKSLIIRQVAHEFFSYSHGNISLVFNSAQYDKILAIEPYDCQITNDHINPIIIRNHDEILSKEEAMRRLRLDHKNKHCLFSLNLEEHSFKEIAQSYAYLGKEGYDIFYSSLFKSGIFPIADYFNAFDLVLCGGGYNAFWEAVYFHKEAVFIPLPKRYENQLWRIDNCRNYEFTKNGADELAEIIAGM